MEGTVFKQTLVLDVSRENETSSALGKVRRTVKVNTHWTRCGVVHHEPDLIQLELRHFMRTHGVLQLCIMKGNSLKKFNFDTWRRFRTIKSLTKLVVKAVNTELLIKAVQRMPSLYGTSKKGVYSWGYVHAMFASFIRATSVCDLSTHSKA